MAGGLTWIVQSVTGPPQVVWNMQHGQVVVSKCASGTAGLTTDASVGPSDTVELCTTSASHDPCLEHDPWKQAVRSVPTSSAGPCVVSHLQEIEPHLEKTLLDKLPVERMETDETESRLHAGFGTADAAHGNTPTRLGDHSQRAQQAAHCTGSKSPGPDDVTDGGAKISDGRYV